MRQTTFEPLSASLLFWLESPKTTDTMNPDILIELAARWEHDAKEPQCEDGHPDAAITNAISKGERQGKRECANALRMLVQLLAVRNQDRAQPVDRRREPERTSSGHRRLTTINH